MIPAAGWYRVSTDEQDSDNQIPDVVRFSEHHGYHIDKVYKVSDSAWDGGGPEYKATRRQLLADAHAGLFRVVIVWAADRLTRGGIEDLLSLIRQLRERGVTVLSVQEPWLNNSDVTQDLLISITAWVAQQESARRSHRVRAGLEKRRAAGLPVGGGVAGRRDRRPRKSRAAADRARMRIAS